MTDALLDRIEESIRNDLEVAIGRKETFRVQGALETYKTLLEVKEEKNLQDWLWQEQTKGGVV